QLLEVFGTGTAAVISPVRAIKYQEKEIEVQSNKSYLLYTRYTIRIGLVETGKVPGILSAVCS
ncbi:unnamed protein product, partial [Laminaria digitata]